MTYNNFEIERISHPDPTEIRVYQLKKPFNNFQFPEYEKAIHADSLNRLVLFNTDASGIDMMIANGQPMMLSKNGDFRKNKLEIADLFYIYSGNKPIFPDKFRVKFVDTYPADLYLKMAAKYVKSEREKKEYEEARKQNTALPPRDFRTIYNFFRIKKMKTILEK